MLGPKMFFGSLNCGFEILHWTGKAEPVGFDQCFFLLSDPIFFAQYLIAQAAKKDLPFNPV
ncbi:hypothetical protein [Pedobacter borealis]|uniref:hypothetical protein n=1 Tax=Pedobacter borealis TaxID=475254 RepID=UPI0004935974|nr:hypothetical protein [Pedobacter borealis]